MDSVETGPAQSRLHDILVFKVRKGLSDPKGDDLQKKVVAGAQG